MNNNNSDIDSLLGITPMAAMVSTGAVGELSVVDRLLGVTPHATKAVENEMDRLPHLAGDLRHQVDGIRRHTIDARKVKLAAQAIGRLPAPAEAFHLIISGRFALWHFVPAVLELAAPAIINNLHICTLGFSKDNITELVALIDASAIGSVSLLASHYFKGTSAVIYDYARVELAKRPAARFLSLRQHAKLLCMALSDGRFVTVESSANLRSSKNVEVATVIGEPGLYAFHVGWINDLFSAAAQHREAKA